MTKEFKQDLKELAKKHGMEFTPSCSYCGHKQEVLDLPKWNESFFVTFTEIKVKD